jgi:hypothetical protein
MPDQPLREPLSPLWPLPELEGAARAHWDDAGRLGLLLRDLALRPEPEARALHARVAQRLRELPADPPARPRVVRRDPGALRAPPPPPSAPTPEMAAVLRLLELERASGATARQEAAALRGQLAQARALRGDTEAEARLQRELAAAREEARAAREEARHLAQRLAFASTSPRAPARPAPPPRAPATDPAYAELGLAPDLPDDLLQVFERALLRHHHPDRAAPEAREAATARFQSVTLAFQRIRRLRGLPG